MPLLEKTNIDQVITNGDSTNVEDDDYGLKDDQRNNGVAKTTDVCYFYTLFELISSKAGFMLICLHGTRNVMQVSNLLRFIAHDPSSFIILVCISASAGV